MWCNCLSLSTDNIDPDVCLMILVQRTRQLYARCCISEMFEAMTSMSYTKLPALCCPQRQKQEKNNHAHSVSFV